MEYKIKAASELTDSEISEVLKAWNIEEWYSMSAGDFKKRFASSVFHLLYDNERIVSLCRVMPDFRFKIDEQVFNVHEFVGFVSIVQGKGYGKELITRVRETLKKQGSECIGFCFKRNRGFYEKCGVRVLEDYAKYFMEPADADGSMQVSVDDDVVDINLSLKTYIAIMCLKADNKKAYLVTE